jgi:phenylpropionate dioxygenase-like ring-hydroxylating dioxygenase large terminal subunit
MLTFDAMSDTLHSLPSERAVAAYYAGLRPFWHAVAPAEAVNERPLAVTLLGQQLVLARLSGRVVAFDDLCRHLGAALSVGEVVDGCYLRCRYHGWAFDESGACVDIPARRDAPIPAGARVRSYPTREAYDLIWVSLDADRARDLPRFPEANDPRFHFGSIRTYEPWRASATRIIMGALDDTHFAWVHPQTLGDPSHPEPPDHRVWRAGDALFVEYTIGQPATALSAGGGHAAAGTTTPVTYAIEATPTTVILRKRGIAGTFLVWLAVCPRYYNESLTFWRIGRDYDIDPAHDHEHEAFQDIVRDEDRLVVESQRPWLLPPLSSSLLLYIRPADLPLIEYQKWMDELDIPQI